jgi:hypothetical protein
VGGYEPVRQPSPTGYPQVSLAGVGMVSLATLDELREARRTEQVNADHLAGQADELEQRAEDRLADAGAHLAPRRDWWQVPGELWPHLQEADRLVARIWRLDERAAADPGPARGPSRALAWASHHLARRDRSRSTARLRQVLVAIARAGAEAGVDVPGVEPLLDEAAELEARARGLRTALGTAAARLAALDGEVRLREEAEQRLGFDSLHLAAYFRGYGMPEIWSPVELAAGETAYLALDVTLARLARTGPAGRRSRGVSFAHTGIVHWVGAFQGCAAPVQQLERLDTGVLVVTSQQLTFAGGAGGVAVPLAAVLDMDVYDDAIAVFQLGREAPQVFLTPDARLAAFYVNWALSSGTFA